MPSVHEALAAGLAAAGVHTVFGLMGSGTDQVTRDLVERHDVRYVATRHEHGAVAMADGFSRVGDEIGVALVSADAGLTNAMTALVTARLAGSRVLVIVGDQASSYKADQTRLDQVPLESALGITTIPVSALTVQRDLQHALRELTSTAVQLSSTFLGTCAMRRTSAANRATNCGRPPYGATTAPASRHLMT